MISVRASLFLKSLTEIYIHIREFRSAKLVSNLLRLEGVAEDRVNGLERGEGFPLPKKTFLFAAQF